MPQFQYVKISLVTSTLFLRGPLQESQKRPVCCGDDSWRIGPRSLLILLYQQCCIGPRLWRKFSRDLKSAFRYESGTSSSRDKPHLYRDLKYITGLTCRADTRTESTQKTYGPVDFSRLKRLTRPKLKAGSSSFPSHRSLEFAGFTDSAYLGRVFFIVELGYCIWTAC